MTDVLSIRDVTSAVPFTAGALVLADDKVVLTLNRDHLPSELDGGRWLRLAGVGGGQEPGETIVQCALREAEEELGVPVEAGAVIVEAEPLAGEARLWVHPEEQWGLLLELVARHPELESLVA